MTEIEVCRVDDVAPGEARRVDTQPPIAVYNIDGDFYATADTCSHAEASLADGWIEGDQVECPFHMAKFCIRTGAALSLPATEPVATFAVRVDAGTVYVEVP
jgi:nitrite reductase/ring-hydroxylating ferredoxin subunit